MAAICSAVMFVYSPADAAVHINPSSTPQWNGAGQNYPQDINPFDADQLEGYVGTGTQLSLLYKSEADGGADSGSFAGSYNTTYGPGDGAATISHVIGQAIITFPSPTLNEVWLVIKDGKHTPYVYAIDFDQQLNDADPKTTWNGTEQILLSGFWPDDGAISHIALFGGLDPSRPTSTGGEGGVPEPATLAIWGLGLGIAGLVRLRRKS